MTNVDDIDTFDEMQMIWRNRVKPADNITCIWENRGDFNRRALKIWQIWPKWWIWHKWQIGQIFPQVVGKIILVNRDDLAGEKSQKPSIHSAELVLTNWNKIWQNCVNIHSVCKISLNLPNLLLHAKGSYTAKEMKHIFFANNQLTLEVFQQFWNAWMLPSLSELPS